MIMEILHNINGVDAASLPKVNRLPQDMFVLSKTPFDRISNKAWKVMFESADKIDFIQSII